MRYFRLSAVALLAITMTMLAAACGGGNESEKGGGATPTRAAATSAPAATYPMQVVDMLNRTVTIKARPQKVLAISPTTLELVYAVGGTSIGRVSSATQPPEAQSLPVIGSSYRPNTEQILQLQPDVIFADSVLQPQLREQLEALQVPLVYVGAGNLNDVMRAERITAQVLGTPANGEQAVQRLQAKLDEIKPKIPATHPKVLILNGAPNDFYVAKPESYVGDLVKTLAGENVAAGLQDIGPFPGYTKLSIEQIVADNPDVILAITAGPPGGQTITQALADNPGWSDINAVKNGRVHEISAEIFLMAPGPRAAEGLAILANFLYPEVFPKP